MQHWTGNAANNASIQKLLNQRNGKIIMSPAGNTTSAASGTEPLA